MTNWKIVRQTHCIIFGGFYQVKHTPPFVIGKIEVSIWKPVHETKYDILHIEFYRYSTINMEEFSVIIHVK